MTPTDQTPTELERRLAEERERLDIPSGCGKHPADAFPAERGTWDPNECNAPDECDAVGWHYHPDQPTVLFWSGVL